MLSHIAVQGVSEPGALQDALCSLLPGGPQHQLGQRMAVMIVDSMTDMLPSWHTAASKRSRFSAQASAAAVGRLTRLVACSCHCAVLTTSTSQPMKPHAAQVSQAIIPRFAGGSADWDTFAAAVAGRFPAAGGAGQWMQEAAGAARWAQQAANSQPHVQFMDATVRLHVWRSTGGSGASFSAACTADEALQAAAVRSPSHAAKAKTAWSISTCIIGRTHAASASNARLSSMHVGSGVDGARAGVLQLPLAVAALAAGDIAAALLGPDENAIATWHAQEWHESLLDMGVAVGCVDKAGVQPPVMPTANSVTQAAAAWSARKSKNTYEPPRLSSRQGKFARVGAPALGSVVPPGKGFWAMRAAALGLLWGLQGDV